MTTTATPRTKTMKLNTFDCRGAVRIYTGSGYMFEPVPVGQLVEEYEFCNGNDGSESRRFSFADQKQNRSDDSWNNCSSRTIGWWRITSVPTIVLVEAAIIPDPHEEDELRANQNFTFQSGNTFYIDGVQAMYPTDRLTLVKD